MPGSSGDKLCPICDSPLQAGSKKCNFCGTDLTIFDIEDAKPKPAPSETPKPTIESMIKDVLGPSSKPEPPARPPVATAPSPEPSATAASFVTKDEPVVEHAAEPAQEKAAAPIEEKKPAMAQAHEYFACPECGAQVETTARTCPGCGVMFAEEGAEMFECPACKTLVSVDATTCTGCGAMFVESEETSADAEPGTAPARKPAELEPPIAEVRAPPPVPQPEAPSPAYYPVTTPEPVMEPARDAEDKKGRRGFGWFRKQKKEGEDEAAPEGGIPGLASIPETPRARAEPAREVPQPSPGWGMRERREPAPQEGKDKGRELARMVAEMKPLLTLANEKDIDIAESKRLIDEAASAGRDRQLDKALDFVSKARALLMTKIDENLTSTVAQLREEVRVARELGGEVSRASTYLSEAEKAKAAGDAEAAYIYAQKVSKELLPITGRYNESKDRIKALRSLVADCEVLIFDTKEARLALSEANKAFEVKDFDKVEMLVKQASDRLYRAIPDRINEEMHLAKNQLIEAKMKNVNTGPLITTLKSVRTLMKAGDYQQAIREMRDFKEQIKKVT